MRHNAGLCRTNALIKVDVIDNKKTIDATNLVLLVIDLN